VIDCVREFARRCRLSGRRRRSRRCRNQRPGDKEEQEQEVEKSRQEEEEEEEVVDEEQIELRHVTVLHDSAEQCEHGYLSDEHSG